MIKFCRQFALRAVVVTACAGALMAGIGRRGEIAFSSEPAGASQQAATPLSLAALPNAYRLHENVISGGQPEGEAGFQTLRELGVRTVISVDGAKPDVSLAKKYGLRYVHLPHGYDGIPEQRVLELAKAVAELPGPIYIHCHHGKHRSPAAAAVACISAGLIAREAGPEILAAAGTSSDYQGLHQAVATAEQRQGLQDLVAEFRESVEVPPMATAMVLIEKAFDNLKLIEKSNWETPPSHPDLSPAHEALLLREQFTELLRTDEVHRLPLEFRALLERTRYEAESLENQARADGAARPVPVAVSGRLSESLRSIGNDCARCHRAHRD